MSSAPQQQQQKQQPSTHNKRLGDLQQYLSARSGQLAAVLPRTMRPDRLLKVAIAAASRNPTLLQCTPESIYASLHAAAQLGLEAGSPLGGAYLVPYRNKHTSSWEAQLIVGYRGLIDLARRSGQIKSIEAHCVLEGDHFELEWGLTPKLIHRPKLDGAADRPLLFVYAVAQLEGSATQSDVMTRAEVDAIRSRSKSKDTGPWVTDYLEMARKTVVRRLAKYLPLTVELADALEADGDGAVVDGELVASLVSVPAGEDGEQSEALPPAKTSKAARLAASLPASMPAGSDLPAGKVLQRGAVTIIDTDQPADDDGPPPREMGDE